MGWLTPRGTWAAMWRRLARFRCRRCGEAHAIGKRALRSPLRPRLAICVDCVDRWRRTGHRCARCWAPVASRLDVGLLVDAGTFVHVACGGARLVGAPLMGVLGPIRPPPSLQ